MTSATASLTKLSPLRIDSDPTGKAISSAIASVAIASEGERIAPKTKAEASGNPSQVCATYAIASVVMMTSPSASQRIGTRYSLKRLKSVDQPPPNKSNGSSTRKTRSGASVTGCIPGISAISPPPVSMTIG